jgi:CheY-like chemotaxis protein
MTLKRDILIVDDESDVLDFLKSGLHTYKDRLNVHTASSGEEALRIIDELQIALVITDIRMPGMDGFELILNVRKRNPDTRFIVMTGYGSDEALAKCEKYKAIDYLSKPFEFGNFVEKMFRALKPARGFWTGKLHGFQLTDALQLVHMVRKSQIIRVNTEFGEECLIYIKDGEVVHAKLEDLEGEEAFYKIIALEGGKIESLALTEQVPITIQRSLGALLLEGMRLKDETNALQSIGETEDDINLSVPGSSKTKSTNDPNESSLPPDTTDASQRTGVPGEDMAEAKEGQRGSPAFRHNEFYQLIDEGFDFFKVGDFPAARKRWEKALELQPDDQTVRFNLKKLEEKEQESG